MNGHCPGCRGWTRNWEAACPGITLENIMNQYARCNFDGRPVSPGDQAVMDEFREFLAQRGRFATGQLPLHGRQLRDGPGEETYWEEWYCQVPPPGASYAVVLQDWTGPADDGHPVRRIFQVRMLDAAETATAARDRDGPARPAPGPGSTCTT